jgi:hypothetical protein
MVFASGIRVACWPPDRVGSDEWVGDADFSTPREASRGVPGGEGPLDRRRYQHLSGLGADVIWDGGDFLRPSAAVHAARAL